MEKLEFPNRITIELTNQCNVSCTFCPRQQVPMEIGFMKKELYYKIIDEAARHLPIKIVIFFRGESLLQQIHILLEFSHYEIGLWITYRCIKSCKNKFFLYDD